MGDYVLAYTGGSTGASPDDQQAIMAQWMGWFGRLGPDILDGGNPLWAVRPVGACRASDGGASSLTEYSIIPAPDLAAATEVAKGCPALAAGGAVEVYEAIEME